MKPTAHRSEKDIEAEIIANLRTLGFLVTKTSQPRASMISAGTPDLYAAHPRWGVRTWIEVKRVGGRLSMWQVAWHRVETESGGTVCVAHNMTEVLDHLRALGAPI